MRNWTKWRSTPSMLIAILALFVALGGTTWAAKKGNNRLKVRSVNIVNGQVKTPDLANNAVTSAKIRNGEVKAPDIGGGAVGSSALAPGAVGALALGSDSVGSQNVQNDSLTGDDISEGSLQGVNAQTLGGASRCGRSGRLDVDRSVNPIKRLALCTVGPFTFQTHCEAARGGTEAVGSLTVGVSENDSFYSTNAPPDGDDPTLTDADWDANEGQKAIVWHNIFSEGAPTVSPPVVFNAFAPSGAGISGQASVRVISRNDGTRSCDFVLSAIG